MKKRNFKSSIKQRNLIAFKQVLLEDLQVGSNLGYNEISFINPQNIMNGESGMIAGTSHGLMGSWKAGGQPKQGAVERKESESSEARKTG